MGRRPRDFPGTIAYLIVHSPIGKHRGEMVAMAMLTVDDIWAKRQTLAIGCFVVQRQFRGSRFASAKKLLDERGGKEQHCQERDEHPSGRRDSVRRRSRKHPLFVLSWGLRVQPLGLRIASDTI